MPQRVHQHDRGHTRHVAEVPRVRAPGDGGAGLRLDANDLQVRLLALDLVLDEGQEHAREVLLEKTETGGNCQPGCHAPLAYDRKSSVDYSAPRTTKAKEKPDKNKDNAENQPKK